MLKSRSRKVLRDIWSRKGRTALVSVAVFIGVLGVVALLSSGDLLIRQLNQDLDQQELAMLRVFVGLTGESTVDNGPYLDMLRQLPGVTQVQGNAVYPISWKLPSGERFSDGYIRAFSEPFGNIQLEPPRLTLEGRYPVAGQKEVAIERRMAKKYGLKAGDPLVLRVLGGARAGAGGVQEETWHISGILFHSYTYFSADGGFVPNDASVYATYADAQYIAGFQGFNSIYARYADYATAERETGQFLASLREDTPYRVNYDFVEDPAQNQFITISQQYTGVISLLAVVAMVVSGFLVTNVISTIVLEQKRQIGVMKSLGATRWDNFAMYAGIALLYGMIGMIPGVLLGVPLGYKLAEYMAQFPNALIEKFTVSPMGVGLGMVMGLLVPVAAAAIPVYKGTRVTILEAMTDLGISTSYGAGRTARLIGALPLPINVRQALSNVVQKKGRLALTVVTLMFAVAAFMAVFAVLASLDTALSGIFDAFGYQIQVNPTNIQTLEEAKTLILGNVPGVQAVQPGVGAVFQVEGYQGPQTGSDQLSVLGIDPRSDTFHLDIAEGSAWRQDPAREGLVLTTSVAEQLNKKVGDHLTVVAGGKTVDLEIIGTDRFPFDQGFMEWGNLARLSGLVVGAPTPNQYTVPTQVEGYTGGLPGGQTLALGMDAQLAGFMPYITGSSFTPGQPGVIVSSAMAEQAGLTVGDELTLQVGDNSRSYPIVGVFEVPPPLTDNGMPPELVGLFWEELAALEGRALTGQPSPSTLYVQMADPNVTSAQVDDAIATMNELLMANGMTASYTNQVAAAEQSTSAILAFGVMFNLTSFVMAAVGAIGLLSTLSMSVFERQKEIGVMRSIGAGSLTIGGQFLIEGLLVGFIAWLIGVPLSYFLGLGLLRAMPFGFIPFQYPLSNLVIGLVGMLLIATIASLWPSIGAARKTVSEIIRYQ